VFNNLINLQKLNYNFIVMQKKIADEAPSEKKITPLSQTRKDLGLLKIRAKQHLPITTSCYLIFSNYLNFRIIQKHI